MRSGWRATHTVLAVAFGGEGHVDIVRFLLEHGADTEASDCVSNSALLLASHHSHHAIMRLLLDKGSNPDINPDGVTVLYRAVSSGRLESVKYLLSKGATLGIEKVSELDDAWLVDVDVCFDLDALYRHWASSTSETKAWVLAKGLSSEVKNAFNAFSLDCWQW